MKKSKTLEKFPRYTKYEVVFDDLYEENEFNQIIIGICVLILIVVVMI